MIMRAKNWNIIRRRRFVNVVMRVSVVSMGITVLLYDGCSQRVSAIYDSVSPFVDTLSSFRVS